MEDQREVVENCEIEVDPRGFHLLAFDDQRSTLARDVHIAIHKKIDFEFPPWLPNGKSGNSDVSEREFEFTISLPAVPMAPSSATIRGHWTCHFDPAESVVVKQVSVTRGVPMGDSFEVVSVFRATKIGENRSQLKVTIQLNFLKYVLMKGMLEKYTIDGFRDYIRIWLEMLKERIVEHNAKAAAASLSRSSDPRSAPNLNKGSKKKRSKKRGPDDSLSPDPSEGPEEVEPTSSYKGLSSGIGLGIALRAAMPSNALILMNHRSTVVTRATLPDPPVSEGVPEGKSQKDEGKKHPEGTTPGSAPKSGGGWAGRMPFSSTASDKHSNGDVPDRSIREMASNVKFLIAQSDGMRSARTVILVLIASHVILILFILYLFNELSAIKGVLRTLHPEVQW